MTGRQDDARQRILDAVIRLMQVKAPSSITGRELAKEAGVNYGLIHHYFGGKDQAMRAAFHDFAQTHLHRMSSPGHGSEILPDVSMSELRETWMVLAHAAIDEESTAIIDWYYPLLRNRYEQRRVANEDLADEEIAQEVAAAFSLAMGWTIFAPFVEAALSLAPEAVDRIEKSITARIFEQW